MRSESVLNKAIYALEALRSFEVVTSRLDYMIFLSCRLPSRIRRLSDFEELEVV